MTITESALREEIARAGKSLYDRGYGVGSSGNISVRLDDGILITPTNTSMGRLDPARLAKLAPDGTPVSGDKPSKEGFLHRAVYARRPEMRAVVHLHSTYSVALSTLAALDPENMLPPITAYFVMRVGTLPLVPYFPPGDDALAGAVGDAMETSHAVLLANHGSVVAGKSLDEAVYAAEELEETAKLWFLLRGETTRYLSVADVAGLRARFPS
jgi:ribulose-5-phosphate 4-epimerase/fuculose-1-phosphate aldolase